MNLALTTSAISRKGPCFSFSNLCPGSCLWFVETIQTANTGQPKKIITGSLSPHIVSARNHTTCKEWTLLRMNYHLLICELIPRSRSVKAKTHSRPHPSRRAAILKSQGNGYFGRGCQKSCFISYRRTSSTVHFHTFLDQISPSCGLYNRRYNTQFAQKLTFATFSPNLTIISITVMLNILDLLLSQPNEDRRISRTLPSGCT